MQFFVDRILGALHLVIIVAAGGKLYGRVGRLPVLSRMGARSRRREEGPCRYAAGR
jgi:hypothetical protein